MIELTGNDLTIEQMQSILFANQQVTIAKDSLQKVRQSEQAVDKILASEQTVYGINTGFGKFSNVQIAPENVGELQLNLIRSHACGVGDAFLPVVAKAMMILRLNAVLKGCSGIRVDTIKLLLDLINKDIIPVIPEQGSLGASGDLAPLAHLALVLIGEGEVFDPKGHQVPAMEMLSKHNLEPIELEAKEGLALINGTQAMTAVGIINYISATKLALDSEWISAMTFESLEGVIDAFYPETHEIRGYPQQTAVAKRMMKLLSGSELTTKQGEKRVQDAYSLRCIPQVHGASWQVFDYVKEKLEIEINAATDNPLIFDGGDLVISGGNFHGQPIAFAMDFLKVAVAELANISERRIERLVNNQLNEGLPAFLSAEPGLQSGAMIMQYAAASLVSENKTLAHPASVDSIPSSANQEDHVSMGTIAARHARDIIQNSRRVLAIEAICAKQALEYRGVEKSAKKVKEMWDKIHEIIPSITTDRAFYKDIAHMEEFLKTIN